MTDIEVGHEQSAQGEVFVQERRKGDTFDYISTEVPGFWYLTEHGVEPNVTEEQRGVLYITGGQYADRARRMSALKGLQDLDRPALAGLAEGTNIRGGRDEKEGWEIQLTPQTHDEADMKKLREELGSRAGEVIHARQRVIIDFNNDEEMEEVVGFLISMRRRLARQGYTPEQRMAMTKVEKEERLDEEELQRMIDAGEITVSSEAWKKVTDRVNVVPRQIVSIDEMRRIDRETRIPKTSNGNGRRSTRAD